MNMLTPHSRLLQGIAALLVVVTVHTECRSLVGDGFGFPKHDAWRKIPQKGLVEHILSIVNFDDADNLANQFDRYCATHRSSFGMNLGHPKGLAIQEAVHEAGQRKNESLIILELGAHLGDGTLRIVGALQSLRGSGHVVVSVENEHSWASGCREVLNHALQNNNKIEQVSVFLSDAAKLALLVDRIREEYGKESFDVVLLDHEHGRYLQDLKILVDKGMLHNGSVVHADNIGRNRRQLKSYIDYVTTAGPFATRIVDVTSPYKDQVSISLFTGEKPEVQVEL